MPQSTSSIIKNNKGTLLIAALIVGCLLLGFRIYFSYVCGLLLFPCVIAALPITGAHGGTTTEERIATVVSFVGNTVIYAFIIIGVRSMFAKEKEPEKKL